MTHMMEVFYFDRLHALREPILEGRRGGRRRFNMDARRLTVWSARLVFVLAVAFLLTNIAEPAYAQVFRITVRLNGAQEVPNPVATAGTATGRIIIDTASRVIMGTVTFTGLSSATIPGAGHIHLAAAPGLNGAVIIPLVGGGGVTAGRARVPPTILSAARMRALRTNRLYINIHTANNPGGEIRGTINWGRRVLVASIDEEPTVSLASAELLETTLTAGGLATASITNGSTIETRDMAVRMEIPRVFIGPSKWGFGRYGIDDLGA